MSLLDNVLKKLILETSNEAALDLYVNLQTTKLRRFDCSKYAQIFGLCRLLGVANIYDIGCGANGQAFLLENYSDMFYTGIDCDENIDFAYINKLFAEAYNERIKFQKVNYPFVMTPQSNNIALCCSSLFPSKNITEALSRDFERVFISFLYKSNEDNDECFKMWENELSNFKLCKMGYYCVGGWQSSYLIFGTRFPKEISMLDLMEYDFNDDRFILEYVDVNFKYK
jgi:hypothetical protein